MSSFVRMYSFCLLYYYLTIYLFNLFFGTRNVVIFKLVQKYTVADTKAEKGLPRRSFLRSYLISEIISEIIFNFRDHIKFPRSFLRPFIISEIISEIIYNFRRHIKFLRSYKISEIISEIIFNFRDHF